MGDIIEDLYAELRQWVAAEGQRSRRIWVVHGGGVGGGTGEPGGTAGIQLDPPRARPGADPRLAAAWNELFWQNTANDAEARDHVAAVQHLFQGGARASNAAAQASLGGSRWQTSRNWSGAVLGAQGGRRVTAATARWTVPNGALPKEAGPAGPVPEMPLPRATGATAPPLPADWRCSVWVGLDGHRLASRSLPQIGTTTVVDPSGQVSAYAWAQWWVRGKMFGEMRFDGFEVQPGDTVTAWLAMLDDDAMALRIRNESREGRRGSAIWVSGQLDASAPAGAKAIHGAEVRAPAEGSAAVWVVERPMVMFGRNSTPLPDFGEVRFERCIAGLAPIGSDPGAEVELVDLAQARLIRMLRPRREPLRMASCAVPATGATTDALVVRFRA